MESNEWSQKSSKSSINRGLVAKSDTKKKEIVWNMKNFKNKKSGEIQGQKAGNGKSWRQNTHERIEWMQAEIIKIHDLVFSITWGFVAKSAMVCTKVILAFWNVSRTWRIERVVAAMAEGSKSAIGSIDYSLYKPKSVGCDPTVVANIMIILDEDTLFSLCVCRDDS